MSRAKQPIAPQDLIATRELVVEGQAEKVSVQLGRPYNVDENEAICPFRFIYSGKVGGHDIHGIDTFQALELALKLLPTCLRSEEYLPIDKMFAWESGDDMGFPETEWPKYSGDAP